MALFKGRDAKIPLLTKFYQLEIGHSNGDSFEFERFFEAEDPYWFNMSVQLLAMGENPHDTVVELVSIHESAKRIMDAFSVEQGTVSFKDLRWLSVAFNAAAYPVMRLNLDIDMMTKEISRTLFPYLEQGKSPSGSIAINERRRDEWDTLNCIPTKNIYWTTGQLDGLEEKIAFDLGMVTARKTLLRRCQVCQCPYVLKRSTQVYCSWRCQNRERVRRQRSKEEN